LAGIWLRDKKQPGMFRRQELAIFLTSHAWYDIETNNYV
jgi:hypothetical protein